MICSNVTRYALIAVLSSTLAACASTQSKVDNPTAATVTEPPGADPWFRSARTGDVAVMKGMVTAGKQVDAPSPHGVTALMVAARSGNLETVKWLIAEGADASKTDKDDQSALVFALTGFAQGPKLAALVDELIRAGANPFLVDKIGFQPIQEMMDLGLDEQIRKLKFTDKKPCDLVPKRPGEISLSRAARRMENIPLAEFLEAQGCW